jgi:flagellar hook-basal body complex protein FliE
MKIDSINPGGQTLQHGAVKAKGGSSFVDLLKDSISKVGELEKEADKEVEKLAKAESQDISGTMIAIEKADLSFQMMMQIRNKIITAYEEIMRTQV